VCNFLVMFGVFIRIKLNFMKSRALLVLTTLFITFVVRGQLVVSQSGTVAQWVQNILLGPGISVSNVTYTGDAQSIGTFTTGNTSTNLGFSSGIILSSGKATDAPGPNNTGSKSTNTTGGSDANLAQLINTTTSNIHDAAILEFDFVPVSDTVKFNYVFGSEEYDEFVGSSFNDVFGFFISGINPYGGTYSNVNIALIPGTSTPVSINNVNNGSSNTGPCNNCAYYNHNNGQSIQYDGLTVVLTAWIRVVPCFTYHIKIAVADVGDHVYDSGVFLQANSFMSNAIMVTKKTVNTIDTAAIEGCNDAIVTFKIPHPVSTNTIINFLAQGTAVNGTDYTNIGNQAVIPAGQDSVNITIHPVLDGIPEPVEYVKLIVNTSACTYDTIFIYIKDNSYIVPVLPPDTVLCGSDTITLTGTVSGGFPKYSYLWSTGDTTASITVAPSVTTVYTFKATDLCSNDSTVSVRISVSEPVFSITGDSICKGQTGKANVTHQGVLTYLWNTGATTSSISASPLVTTTYNVRITDTLGCYVDTSATIFLKPAVMIQASADTVICNSNPVNLWAKGGVSYKWSNGKNTSSITVRPSNNASYTVTVTNAGNCWEDTVITVGVVKSPDARIVSSSDTVCRGSQAVLTASGGDSYLWSTGEISEIITVSPAQTTVYSVVASNSAQGLTCYDTAVFSQGVKRCNRFYTPTAFTPDGDGLNDDFGVEGVFKNLDSFEFIVFDRWGRVVFRSTDPLKRWDGRVNGQDPLPGVYSYIAKIHETFSEPYVLSGTVTLIK